MSDETRSFPHPLGDTRKHLTMARDMSKAMGVDLEQAQRKGQLNQQDWSNLITRCRGCADVETCKRWLENGDLGVKRHPPVCANAGLLQALAKLR